MDREIGRKMTNARRQFEQFPRYQEYYNPYTKTNMTQPQPRYTRPRRNNQSQNRRINKYKKKNKSLLQKMEGLTRLLLAGILLAAFSINIKDRGTGKYENYNQGQVVASGPSSNKLSLEGKKSLKSFEGFKPNAYKLPGEKYWTIGYGHNGPDVKPGQTISKEQADKMFDQDIQIYEKAVSNAVTVPISQNMFDALVIFTYNNGIGDAKMGTGFLGSTLLKKLNSGDYLGAKNEFGRWVRANGKVSEGLVKRRAFEADLFGKDISPNNKLMADKVGKSPKPAKGDFIGNYQLETNRVKLSEPMRQYLANTGGKGLVTSGIRAYIPGQNFDKSHASGNKVDIGLGGLTQEQIIKTVVPFMMNPATVHVAFEGLGRTRGESKNISKNIMNIIYSRYPEIKSKVKDGKLLIYHWGWEYSSEPHIDILIDPNKVNYQKPEVNIANKNVEITKNNIESINKKKDKPKKVSQDKNQSKMIALQGKDKTKLDKGLLNTLSHNQTYKNTNKKRIS